MREFERVRERRQIQNANQIRTEVGLVGSEIERARTRFRKRRSRRYDINFYIIN